MLHKTTLTKHLVCVLTLAYFMIGCTPSGSVQTTATVSDPLAVTDVASASPDATPTATATMTATNEVATITLSPTVRPTKTPTPLPTPTFTPVVANTLHNSDYGVAWAVPVGWWDVSDQLPPPTSSTHPWSAWASEDEAAPLLSRASFPQGLMLLTLHVEPDEPSLPQPLGEAGTTLWGQPVWRQEIEGADAAPFALRLAFSSIRPPYRYTFALDCAPPSDADPMQHEAFVAQCRHVWDFVSFSFGLCTLPKAASGETIQWQQVSDDWYQYAFEIPSDWLILEGTTADRLNFFSDAGVYGQPNVCPLPNGLMKLDFAVDAPGNFGTGEPGSGPDLEGFTAITVADHPAWIQTVQGGEAMGPLATGTAVYIQGPQFWYTFWLSCTPPTDADPAGQTWFKMQCEEAVTHILNSFQILESE